MSIVERPYGLASLSETLEGSVVFGDHPSWDEAREDPARGSVVTRALAPLLARPGVRPAVRGGLRAANVLHRRKGKE